MRAVLIERFGVTPSLREVADPVCAADAVVVRVQATGLCRSDWHALMGHDPDVALPHVPGHEFAGVIDRVGASVAGWAPGDRVTAPFVNACGRCAQCRAGDQQVCAAQTQPGFSRWGSFADLVTVEAAEINLVALPDSVDAATAAGLGCRFATAYRAVVEVARVATGEWVAVHGCGGVGLSAVMIARAAGARVLAVDVSGSARALAIRFGAEAVLDAAGPDGPLPWQAVAARVREATGGGTEVSLDALGSGATCAASIGSLRPRGRHVQVGLLPSVLGMPEVPMHLVVAGELQVLGSHGMAARSYPGMLAMVAAGRLDPGALVTRRIPLELAGAELLRMGLPDAVAGVTVVCP